MRIVKELYNENKYPFDDYADTLTNERLGQKPKKDDGESSGRGSLTFETVEDEMLENLDTNGTVEESKNKKNPLRRLYWLWKQRRMNKTMLKVLDVVNGFNAYPSQPIALLAVEQNGICLRFIKNQSEKICIEAVKQNWKALRYVKNLTKTICDTAIQYHGDAPQTMIAGLTIKATKKRFLSKLFTFKP